MATSWPTDRGSIFFSGDYPKTSVSRAVRQGKIRKIVTGVYTADLTADLDRMVADHRWRIIAHFMPDAVIADRSAATGGAPVSGVLFVVSGERRTPLELPGLTIVPRQGSPALEDDLPWPAGLSLSSDARTLVDNLTASRSRGDMPARTLRRSEIEQWLIDKYQSRADRDRWLRTLRSRAIEIASDVGVPGRTAEIEELVGLAGRTRKAVRRVSAPMRAHLRGTGWDHARIAAFDSLAETLASTPDQSGTPDHLSPPNEGDGFTLPFFEAYFSNFIEGTKFTVEEAEAIVRSGRPSQTRPEDAHDILGTWRVVSDPIGRKTTTEDADAYVDLLRDRHRAILGGRPETKPGTFKTKPNQAGTYRFVDPELVEGTLRRGLSLVGNIPPGFARAVYVLFVISEVHPFEDGNGRAARACMTAELSAADQSRLIIPTVWRNEYLSGLRKASRHQQYGTLVDVLAHAWRWTAAMPWHDRGAVEGQLLATNALMDSTDAADAGKRLTLP